MSGSFFGIALTTVLYGGGPGATLGLVTAVVGWLHSREPVQGFV